MCVCLLASAIMQFPAYIYVCVCVCVCVCLYLPLGVVMLLQHAGVCSRQHHQAAVLPVHFLHRRPGADDPVSRAEREVMQVLMHRVTGRLLTWNNR